MLVGIALRLASWGLNSLVLFALSQGFWESNNFRQAQREDADEVFRLCQLARQTNSLMTFFQAYRPAWRVILGSITGKREPQPDAGVQPMPMPQPVDEYPIYFDEPLLPITPMFNWASHYNRPHPPAPTANLGLGARLDNTHFDEEALPQTHPARSFFDPISFELMEDPVRAYYRWPQENFDRVFICDRSSYIILRNSTGQHPENERPFIRVESAPDIKAEILAFVVEQEAQELSVQPPTP